jgi:hypothetical protein
MHHQTSEDHCTFRLRAVVQSSYRDEAMAAISTDGVLRCTQVVLRYSRSLSSERKRITNLALKQTLGS